ncbi:uncharacterized protein LOC110454878 isoform X2 [Mizuhopecten yessoensis]|uniref:uncharacterized protein LOC110454878 isoform X2 n=1 Tax=Mizuhopecten yessoensis TaxID=6573 RepID=UPI000B4597BD|nr:uncharacterized protein LOC110454878 isoform X2 [Mizuhopecten yessoensis]
MPRRKPTISLPMKRALDDENDGKDSSTKKAKPTGDVSPVFTHEEENAAVGSIQNAVPDGHESPEPDRQSIGEQTPDTHLAIIDEGLIQTGSFQEQPCEVKGDNCGAVEEDSTLGCVGGQSGASSEKRNLSLEALFQVTDNELQNISRQRLKSPQQLIIDETQKATVQEVDGNIVTILPSDIILDEIVNGIKYSKQISVPSGESPNMDTVTYQSIQINTIETQPAETVIQTGGTTLLSAVPTETTGRRRKHPQKPGRHICPFCGRGCAKPSVLLKHLRAHTGERPYPCVSCGFSFKTKSNLYKHCKSRAHALKSGLTTGQSTSIDIGEEEATHMEEMDDSDENSSGTESGGESQKEAEAVHEVEELSEKREHAQIHVLQEVAKYLEKPKEERPKVEVPQSKFDGKQDKFRTIHDRLKAKLKRSFSLTEPLKHVTVPQLERKFSQADEQKFHKVQSQYLKIAPKQGSSGATVKIPAEKTKQGLVSPIIIQTPNTVTAPASVSLKKAVMSQSTPQLSGKKEEVSGTGGASTGLGEHKNPRLHALSMGLPQLTGSPIRQVPGRDYSGPLETVKLPQPNASPAVATKALRDLEALSESFKNASRAGLKLYTSVNNLPDRSCQITIEVLSSNPTGGPSMASSLTSQTVSMATVKPVAPVTPDLEPRSAGVESKEFTPEMLSERIQKLISANAAIVSTPMADPPRHKRISRQNSEVSTPGIKVDFGQLGTPSSPRVFVPVTTHVSLRSLSVDAEAHSAPVTHEYSTQTSTGSAQSKTPGKEGQVLPDFGALGHKSKSQEKNRSREDNDTEEVLEAEDMPDYQTDVPSGVVQDLKDDDVPSSHEIQVASSDGQTRKMELKSRPPLVRQNSVSSYSLSTKASVLSDPSTSPPQTVSVSMGNGSNDLQTKTMVGKNQQGQEITIKIQLSKPTDSTGETRKLENRKENSAKEGDSYGPHCCPKCKVSFKKEQTLELHKLYYCKPSGTASVTKPVQALTSARSLEMIDQEKVVRLFTHGENVIRKVIPQGNSSVGLASTIAGIQAGAVRSEITTSQHKQSDQEQVVMATPTTPIQVMLPSSSSAFAINMPITPTTPLTADNQELSIFPRKKGRPKGSKNRPKDMADFDMQGYVPVQIIGPVAGPSTSGTVSAQSSVPILINLGSQTSVARMLVPASPVVLSESNLKLSDMHLNQTHSVTRASSLTKEFMTSALHSPLTSVIPIIPVTPVIQTGFDHNDSQSHLKQRLKGKLLMKRSLSIDKFSPEGTASIASPLAEVPTSLDIPISMATDSQEALNRKRKLPESPLIGGSTLLRSYSEPVAKLTKLTSVSVYDQQQVSSANVEIILAEKSDTIMVPTAREQYIFHPSQILSHLMFTSNIGSSKQFVPKKTTNVTDLSPKILRSPSKSKLKAALLGEMVGDLSSKTCNGAVSCQTDPPSPTKSDKNLASLTLLGHSFPSLRVNTHTTFCCVQRPQPMYVLQGINKRVSMYSNWKLSQHDPNPVGLSCKMLLELYDSHYTSNPVCAIPNSGISKGGVLTHSSYWSYKQNQRHTDTMVTKPTTTQASESATAGKGDKQDQNVCKISAFKGGYKSMDEYTYIRGRGRGKYVCEKCGIRCKKPSMLKKHIRSHTDLRPYHCKHCRFSFKTKGNLTKHMKSKAHHKKCVELGIIPIPTQVDESQIDSNALAAQCALSKVARIVSDREGKVSLGNEDSDEDEENMDMSDDEDDIEEGEESGEVTLIEVEEDARPGSVGAEEIIDDTAESSSLNLSSVEQGLLGLVPVVCSTIQPILQVQASEKPVVSKAMDTGDDSITTGDSMATNRPNGTPRLGTVYGFEQKESNTSQGVSSGDGVDSEIACSLLELSKQSQPSSSSVVDPQTPDTTGGSAKTIETRLGNLISELIMRTMTDDSKRILLPLGTNQVDKNTEEKSSTINHSKEENAQLVVSSHDQSNSDSTSSSQKGFLVTVPLGGFMPPMLSSSLPTTSSEISVELAKLFNIGLKEPIRLHVTSPDQPPSEDGQSSTSYLPFQFSHPFHSYLNQASGSEGFEKLITHLNDQARKLSSGSVESIKVNDPENPVSVSLDTSDPDCVFIRSEVTSPKKEESSGACSYVILGENSSSRGGKFVCDICMKAFQENQQLVLHRNIHFIEKPFKCDTCHLAFKTHSIFMKHQQSEPHQTLVRGDLSSSDNPRPFRCDDCDIAFRMKGHLAKHLRSKNHVQKWEQLGRLPVGTYNKYETAISGLEASDISVFLQTLVQFTKTAGTVLGTSVSGEHSSSTAEPTESSGKDIDSFQSHRKAAYERHEHASNERVTVELIKQEPIDIGDIGKDQEEEEKDSARSCRTGEDKGLAEGPHMCGICRKGFRNLDHLKSHLITHAELRPYVCEYCDAGFTNAQSLKIHLQTHAQERPYVCGICGDTFDKAENLKIHVEEHNKAMSSWDSVTIETNDQGDLKVTTLHQPENEKTDAMETKSEGTVIQSVPRSTVEKPTTEVTGRVTVDSDGAKIVYVNVSADSDGDFVVVQNAGDCSTEGFPCDIKNSPVTKVVPMETTGDVNEMNIFQDSSDMDNILIISEEGDIGDQDGFVIYTDGANSEVKQVMIGKDFLANHSKDNEVESETQLQDKSAEADSSAVTMVTASSLLDTDKVKNETKSDVKDLESGVGAGVDAVMTNVETDVRKPTCVDHHIDSVEMTDANQESEKTNYSAKQTVTNTDNEAKHRGLTVDHTGLTVEHTGLTAEHTGLTVEHTGHTVDPTGHTVDPTGLTVEPTGLTVEHTGHTVDPTGHTVDPTGLTVEPTGLTVEHTGHTAEHTGLTVEHTRLTVEPTGLTVEPTGLTVEHIGHTAEPTDPAAVNTDPVVVKTGQLVEHMDTSLESVPPRQDAAIAKLAANGETDKNCSNNAAYSKEHFTHKVTDSGEHMTETGDNDKQTCCAMSDVKDQICSNVPSEKGDNIDLSDTTVTVCHEAFIVKDNDGNIIHMAAIETESCVTENTGATL